MTLTLKQILSNRTSLHDSVFLPACANNLFSLDIKKMVQYPEVRETCKTLWK